MSEESRTRGDTEITLVAPDTFGFFLPVVVQTSPGVSNDNVTIEILGIPSSPPSLTRRIGRQPASMATDASSAK